MVNKIGDNIPESNISGQQQPAAEQPSIVQPQPKISSTNKLLIPILGLVVLILIVGAAYFILSPKTQQTTSTTTTTTTIVPSTTTVPQTNQSKSLSPCYIDRSPQAHLVGSCSNATPSYVSEFTNKTVETTQTIHGTSGAEAISSSDWFYLSKPYDSSGFNFSANKWYSFVSIINISNPSDEVGTAYANGKQIFKGSGSALSAMLYFGAYAQYKYMSNIQVYNYSLTQQQISELYSEGLGGLPVNLTHLIEWFPLNNNTVDYSGYNQTSGYTNLTFTTAYNYS